MRRLNIMATLALLAVASGCAGFNAQKHLLMPAMGIVWSTQVTPLIIEETQGMPIEQQTALLVAAAEVQRLLDTGEVPGLSELWLILKPVAAAAIEKLEPNEALLANEALRQFELNLVRLVVSSTQFQEN